uniref:ATPase AAA-type core domain-containing protein n=1 Tax=Nelumbo nucifera TaxID=4432 RepID=A0A822Z7G1_NELNU|nr:TPA_asm: hypothetical protein HUJ06_015110 [Nelumbo nucifera]
MGVAPSTTSSRPQKLHLPTKITPSVNRLKVGKAQAEKNLSVGIEAGEEIVEVFQGIQLNGNSSVPRQKSEVIKEENKIVKLHSLGSCAWVSVNLNHPATFDTLAMDSMLKKEVMEDLARVVKRREFYRKVGKVWKRGYLLYVPPGIGKSSLIAAMANYLNYDIYDLGAHQSAWQLRTQKLLTSTFNNQSINTRDRGY